MLREMGDIEAIPGQREGKHFHERSAQQCPLQYDVAAQSDSLAGKHSVNRMEFFPKAQISLAGKRRECGCRDTRSGKPAQPGRRLGISVRPLIMDQRKSKQVHRRNRARIFRPEEAGVGHRVKRISRESG